MLFQLCAEGTFDSAGMVAYCRWKAAASRRCHHVSVHLDSSRDGSLGTYLSR